jgi:hypothetical protein
VVTVAAAGFVPVRRLPLPTRRFPLFSRRLLMLSSPTQPPPQARTSVNVNGLGYTMIELIEQRRRIADDVVDIALLQDLGQMAYGKPSERREMF